MGLCGFFRYLSLLARYNKKFAFFAIFIAKRVVANYGLIVIDIARAQSLFDNVKLFSFYS